MSDRDSWSNGSAPKRILALDGGGIRGMLSLGILKHVEDLLRKRAGGNADFRLAHYFDLIAGTSTGSIIAAALARGLSVDEIRDHYRALGAKVFEKSPFRKGLVRAKYDAAALSRELKKVLGGDTLLGRDALQTGLLVMLKRLDTGSPWPVTNNPADRYYEGDPEKGLIANADYPLWKVVRASTAAPSFFDPESIVIARETGKDPVKGSFVDGGVSPHNNPSLQALLYATLDGFGVRWPLGADRLLLVSIGTGRGDAAVEESFAAAKHAVSSLLSLMNDCADLVETLLQWLSKSRTARVIDGAIGSLDRDLLGGRALLSYARYDVTLTGPELAKILGRELPAKQLGSIREMDAPANLPLLEEIGLAAGARDMRQEDFPPGFDRA